MGALVTSFYIDNVYNKAAYCGLRRWCHVAAEMQSVLPGLEVIIFHNNETFVRGRRRHVQHQDLRRVVLDECPHARVVYYPPDIFGAVARWERRECYESDGKCHGFDQSIGLGRWMLKWSAVDPRHYINSPVNPPIVLLLDADVDATWQVAATALGPGGRHDVTRLVDAFAGDTLCQLSGTADHSSPINGGVLLLKPSRAVYEEGLELLRTRSFSGALGFNNSGSLQSALNMTMSALSVATSRSLIRTYAYQANTWNFVNGESDQGLFTTMYMARGERRFCAPRHRRLHVWHFMAREKPWLDPPSCKRYFAFLNASSSSAPAWANRLQSKPVSWAVSKTGASATSGTPCTRYLLSKLAKMNHNRTRCRGAGSPVF